MSGGHFDYKQSYIEHIADEIQELIDDNHSVKLDNIRYGMGQFYSDEIIHEFTNAVKFLRIAKIYAQRVDWLVSGDDSENCFLRRLKEELNEFHENQLVCVEKGRTIHFKIVVDEGFYTEEELIEVLKEKYKNHVENMELDSVICTSTDCDNGLDEWHIELDFIIINQDENSKERLYE